MGVEQQISSDMRIAIATALLSKTFQVLESHNGFELTKGDINKATVNNGGCKEMTGDNGDPVNFLDLVRHIRESAIVVWNEMDANKNGYIDYQEMKNQFGDHFTDDQIKGLMLEFDGENNDPRNLTTEEFIMFYIFHWKVELTIALHSRITRDDIEVPESDNLGHV